MSGPPLTLRGASRPLAAVLAAGGVALLFVPFASTFGELLTQLALATDLDAALGRWIAPAEGWLARGLLALFGLPSASAGSLLIVGEGARAVPLYIAWNCVGWQTGVLFALSLVTGLQGSWPARSRLEVVVLGLFGIVILNVLRVAIIAVVAHAFGPVPAILVHDYGSILATVAYLVLFWVFAYGVVLRQPAGPVDPVGRPGLRPLSSRRPRSDGADPRRSR